MKGFKKYLKRKLPVRLVNLLKAINVAKEARYAEDGLITTHYPDTFTKDPAFVAFYDRAVEWGLAIDDSIRWRAHTIVWAAQRGARLEGDFVECGVDKGFLSKIACDYVGFHELPKTFYLLDTYEGLVENLLTKEEREKGKTGGGYQPSYEKARDTFRHYKNVKLIKGPIPDTLPQVPSKRIAYLSIDMNCTAPEIAAAEYFWDKLVPGAAIVLDDYGWATFEEQRYAFDKFAKRKAVPILCLPTGQGVIIKP